jgi:CheY-like chemotaxis protein
MQPGPTKSTKPTRTDADPHRVLVAEDDPHDQMLFIMAAEDAGAEIDFDFVPNGEAFVEELRQRAAAANLPDVGVLDMRMPRLDGHEVLDALVRNPSIRPAEVGIFSSSHRQQDIDQSLAKGAAWHEVKPSKFEDLIAFVTRIDARCRELRQLN